MSQRSTRPQVTCRQLGPSCRISTFERTGGAREVHLFVEPERDGAFADQLEELIRIYRKALGTLGLSAQSGIFRRCFVSDAANHAVVVLDRASGAELLRFGEKGSGEGDFFYPTSLALGPEGDLYVSDSFNFRVQRLEPDGSFVRSVGSVGRKLGQFARPKGVAVDREGRIFALDGAFDNCQIFDPEGKLLLFFGGAGGSPGSMNLPAVVKVEYDAVEAFRDRVAPGRDIEYVVLVTSQAGPFKVNVYGLLRER